MDFLSRIPFASKVIPGVVVTFRRASAPSRAAYAQSVAQHRSAVRELEHKRKPEHDAYLKALEAAKAEARKEVDRLIEAEGITRKEAEARAWDPYGFELRFRSEHPDWADLSDQILEIQTYAIATARLRAQFVSIEGLTIDGEVPDADALIERGPEPLIDELALAAQQIAELPPDQRGESLWPGTSPQPADGTTPSTDAMSAASEPAAA